MDRISKLKLSNDVSMSLLKNEFPVNGKVVITISLEDGKVSNVELKNSNSRKRGE